MADENKYADELLSDEQLNHVAGGIVVKKDSVLEKIGEASRKFKDKVTNEVKNVANIGLLIGKCLWNKIFG